MTYAEANDALRALVEATGIPSSETQAGKGSLPFDHPLNLGAVGATGNPAANLFAREADLVIGIGTRYSDFTTASRTIFQNPDVKFININVAPIDAVKHSGLPVQADAKRTLEALTPLLDGYSTSAEYQQEAQQKAKAWDDEVVASFHSGYGVETRCAGPGRGARRGRRGDGRQRCGGLRRRFAAG